MITHKSIAPLLIELALLLCSLSAVADTEGPGPQHVMSLSMCTDALLLELLPPSRISSITYLSRKASNVRQWPQAARIPINYGSAEEVLTEQPDLVLAGTFTTPTARRLIKAAGIPLLEVPPADSFADIRATTRNVAGALHRDDAARQLIERMDDTLRQLQAARPAQAIRVAGWDGSGAVPGHGTLFDAILEAAGGVNIAAGEGKRSGSFDIEQLLAAQPDVLAYGSDAVSAPSLQSEAALHPLLMKLYAGRRVVYPQALFSCGVVESADAAVLLRASLQEAMLAPPTASR